MTTKTPPAATIAMSKSSVVRKRIQVHKSSILVTSGPHKGTEIPIKQDMVFIGRDPWSDLALPNDPLISNSHCELRIDEQGVRIRDLQSRNGVYLDGHQVFDAFWSPKSPLTLGTTQLKLKVDDKKQNLDLSFIDPTGELVGRSAPMRKIFTLLARLGKRDVSVLFTGDTGTGKTSFAHALHQQSNRQKGPFISVNCGALPPSLIESALFGHEKGAFTGAHQAQAGYFEQANGGTIFLDEIGELPLSMQPKLLAILETQTVQRLGSPKTIPTNFRLVAATHRNLLKEVEAGTFREDLYYRLSAVPLHVPSLRDRPEDIPLLIEKLLQDLAPDEAIQFTPAALQKLKSHPWPGNIRQLRNTLEQALVFMDSPTIEADEIDLPEATGQPTRAVNPEASIELSESANNLTVRLDLDSERSLRGTLEGVEKQLLLRALEQKAWDVTNAASHLGISVPWLYRRMKKFEIKRPG